MKRSLTVTLLGYIFFGISYVLQVLIFRSLNEQAISEYSVFMAMLMFVPFLLGLEKHVQRSRNIAHDIKQPIQFGVENIIVLTIVTLGLLEKEMSNFEVALTILICTSELLILEGTRVLTARGESIESVVIGGIRAMSPLIAFHFVPAINSGFLLSWLVLSLSIFALALITGTFKLSDYRFSIVGNFHVPWVYFFSGTVKAAFPWFTRTALIYFLGSTEMANVVIAMSIFALVEMFVQNFWLTAQYKKLMSDSQFESKRIRIVLSVLAIYFIGFLIFAVFQDFINTLYNKDLYLWPIIVASLLSLLKVLSSVYSVFQIKMKRKNSVLLINVFVYVISIALLHSFWLGMASFMFYIFFNHVKVNYSNLSE